ncbi:MAG: peptide chain release factor N(5)-glutamine methyltransferase [Actinobacteria bacterium]|nr:peptide chain release factor N(5)-glutamine methyltransferase [Actinomycetota bacterium]
MQASKQEWDIRKLLDWAIKYFNLKEIPQPKLSAELLLSSVLGLSRMQLYLNFGYILKEKELAKFKEYILRRLKNEPVQYILKEAFFRNLKLYVDGNVLIPRPETELLVDKLLITLKENKEDILSADKTLNILDIGTGSGNIALSIASEIKNFLFGARHDLWHIITTDIEKSAIAIAEKNAKKNLSDSEIKNIEFINCDIIPDLDKAFNKNYKSRINIVISNPPYITVQDYESLPDEVRNYEPRPALMAGTTGLEIYEKILEKIKDYIDRKLCYMFFEADPNIAGKLKNLLEKKLNTEFVVIDKDYNQRERIITVKIKDAKPK